jgi:hypothetical protein
MNWRRILSFIAFALAVGAGMVASWYVAGAIISQWPWLSRWHLTLAMFFICLWAVRAAYKKLR